MQNHFIGQSLGILATVITFLSYQTNKKRTLLAVQTLATLCTCLSFLFLGAKTGFALNIVCIVRNVVFYFQDRNSRYYYPSVGILTLAMVVLGVLSWQGAISLLMILALAVNTVYISLGNPQRLRKSILVTSTMVLVYNVFVFSIGGMANEGLSIVSAVIGIIRYKNADKTE